MKAMSVEAIELGFNDLGLLVDQLKRNWHKMRQYCAEQDLAEWLKSNNHRMDSWVQEAENGVKKYERTELNFVNLKMDIVVVCGQFEELAMDNIFVNIEFEDFIMPIIESEF